MMSSSSSLGQVAPILPLNVALVRQKAAQNTTQWQAFKNRLDNGDSSFGGLNSVIDGTFEGSGNLSIPADYALGAYVLALIDPITARKYADKAIALLNSLCNDYQSGYGLWSVAWQPFAITDGSSTIYTLPQSPSPTSSFIVRMTTAYNVAVTHSTNAIDQATSAPNDICILKISNSSGTGAAANYTQGTDWQQIGDVPGDGLLHSFTYYPDWTLGSANQPANGATYFITGGSPFDLPGGTVSPQPTLSGNQITFSVAPAAGNILWAKFLYVDSAGRNYQQSSNGRGGYVNSAIDSGFVLHFLGKYGALTYNWLLAGGFRIPAALDARLRSLLYRWFKFTTRPGNANGLARFAPYTESNYSIGYYVGNVLGGLALRAAGDANGAAMLATMTSFRTTNVLRTLVGKGQPAGTVCDSGYWTEGYDYGDNSTISHVYAALAGEQASLWQASDERAAFAAALTSLNHSRYQRFDYFVDSSHGNPQNWHRFGYIAPLGDNLDYPYPWPSPEFTFALSYFLTGQEQTWAQWENANTPAASTNDINDVLFHDPTQAGADPALALPLDYHEVPTGYVVARSDWQYGPGSLWLAYICGDQLQADHQNWAAGSVMINRGPDDLIINAMNAAAWENFVIRSRYTSLPVLTTAAQSPSEVQQGFYGYYHEYTDTADSSIHDPTPAVTSHEANPAAGYTYVKSNVNPAYSAAGAPGQGNCASECTRDWFYLRNSAAFICYDRVRLLSASNSENIRWWTQKQPNLAGNHWSAYQGASKVFAATFSSANIVTRTASETLSSGHLGGTFWRTDVTRLNYTTDPVRYLTALQITDSTVSSMAPNARVVSTDGQAEGALLGNNVGLFASTPPLTGTIRYTYPGVAGQKYTHFVADLAANQLYSIQGADVPFATSSAAGILTFTSTVPVSGPLKLALPPLGHPLVGGQAGGGGAAGGVAGQGCLDVGVVQTRKLDLGVVQTCGPASSSSSLSTAALRGSPAQSSAGASSAAPSSAVPSSAAPSSPAMSSGAPSSALPSSVVSSSSARSSILSSVLPSALPSGIGSSGLSSATAIKACLDLGIVQTRNLDLGIVQSCVAAPKAASSPSSLSSAIGSSAASSLTPSSGLPSSAAPSSAQPSSVAPSSVVPSSAVPSSALPSPAGSSPSSVLPSGVSSSVLPPSTIVISPVASPSASSASASAVSSPLSSAGASSAAVSSVPASSVAPAGSASVAPSASPVSSTAPAASASAAPSASPVSAVSSPAASPRSSAGASSPLPSAGASSFASPGGPSPSQVTSPAGSVSAVFSSQVSVPIPAQSSGLPFSSLASPTAGSSLAPLSSLSSIVAASSFSPSVAALLGEVVLFTMDFNDDIDPAA